MWLDFITYFIFGFSITAVPGAVFFETIRRTLEQKTTVYRFLLGNFSGMFLIVTFSVLGLAPVVKVPMIANIFYLLSGLVLIYIGLVSVVNPSLQHIRQNAKRNYPYSMGLVLAFFNPLSILFWISLIGKISLETYNFVYMLGSLVSIFAGSATLFVILIIMIRLFRVKIKQKHIVILSRFFGVVVLVYGLIVISNITLLT